MGDKASKNRRKSVQSDIANLEEELQPLKEKWESDRGRADEIKSLKERLTNLENKAASAERMGDYEKAADLKYGAIPDLKSHLNKIIQKEDEKKSQVVDDANMVSEVVTPAHITDIISRRTGIPVSKLSQTDRERLLKLDERLKERVIGQDRAVQEVVDCVLRSKAGLARGNQPTGSFLFCGPTGCGKTELAKALFSELYDGDERHLVRIDMSEYSEAHSVARLIGAPPGYVGHDAGGQLTEAIRRKPFSVLLFDEVEKAHKDIMNVLLQVLDDGRLTDGRGRVVDFTNTIVIMTTNIGSSELICGDISANEKAMVAVQHYFRPELLNRLQSIIPFNSLTKKDLREIVRQLISEIQERLSDRRIDLFVDDDACDLVLDQSYAPEYGARPIRRYLEATIVTELSRRVIAGTLTNDCAVNITKRTSTDNSECSAIEYNVFPKRARLRSDC